MLVYLKRLIRNYFGFTGHQINGFLILIPVMFLFVLAGPAYRYWVSVQEPDFSKDAAFLDSLVVVSFVDNESPLAEAIEIEYSFFDPNKIEEAEFVALGFPPYVAKRIVNYRLKGGQFRIKSDLAKIYGLPPTLYQQVEPYIALPDKIEKKATQPTAKTKRPPYTKRIIQPFDLNTADTAQLKQITGIGNVLSERIVKYRTQLGGFISTRQLAEVYHLDSTTITRLLEHAFIEENFQPQRINVNSASEKELSKHPYISYGAAKAIVTYRFQHGKFATLDDLENVITLTPEERKKIKLYLSIE